MLPVPFIPQVSVTANKFAEDCSLACLLMVGHYMGKMAGVTVNALASESSLRFADVGLGADEVAALATAHGLPMVVRRGVDVTVLRWELDHKRPIICAINEWKIPGRPGNPVSADGAHDIVLIGYSGNIFTAHDPAGRASMPIAAADLAAAMHPRGDTAILVTAPDAPPPTRPLARAGTTTAKLNVREKPSTASRIITTLAKGARVLVAPDVAGWLKIAEGQYVSADWVSF